MLGELEVAISAHPTQVLQAAAHTFDSFRNEGVGFAPVRTLLKQPGVMGEHGAKHPIELCFPMVGIAVVVSRTGKKCVNAWLSAALVLQQEVGNAAIS